MNVTGLVSVILARMAVYNSRVYAAMAGSAMMGLGDNVGQAKAASEEWFRIAEELTKEIDAAEQPK